MEPSGTILWTATQCNSCSHLLMDTKTSCFYSIQPRDVSESAPSSLNVKTPQDTVNLASSCIPPADFVYSKIPASTQMYLGAEPSHGVPEPFQYDLPPEDIFPSTNQPCQSYAGRYDPSCHFLPSSSSTGSLSMEHCVEPYQQWLDPKFPNAQYIIPQPILSYASNASSTFPDDLDNIYAGSSHSMMTSANDGTGTTLPFPFPNYDAKYLHSYDYMPRWSSFLAHSYELCPFRREVCFSMLAHPMIFIFMCTEFS